MLRGNWRTILTTGGIILSGLVLGAIVYDLNAVDSAIKDGATNRSDNYAYYAGEDIRKRCGALPIEAQPDCTAKADQTARENQRVELDLSAQQATAWWTKVMGIAALIGMALSVVGVSLV